MKVRYSTESGKTEAQLSKIANWELFDSIAHSIKEQFDGHWVEQIDGVDQRYWDLKVDDVMLTLHLEHYLGISLFPANEPGDLAKANALVETIGAFVGGSLSESKSAG
jgi:hypothetical protein